MSYFPAFIDIKDRDILIVGGGKIATEKLEKLLQFTTNIKIVAKEISDDMQSLAKKHDLTILKREYKDSDLKDISIVIVAVDNLSLQRYIYKQSRQSRILCNSVDSIEYCDFIFPSFIKEGDLIVAISTSGASPAVAKYLKKYLKKTLPNNIGTLLKELKNLRLTLPKGKSRMEFLDKTVREFFEKL